MRISHHFKLVLISFLLSPLLASAENLVKNGDFEQGTSGWKGDRKAGSNESDTNRYLIIEADSKESQYAFQDNIDGDDKWTVEIHFRYRTSEDFNARKVMFKLFYGDDYAERFFWTLDTDSSGKWVEWHNKFELRAAPEKLKVWYEVSGGEGEFHLDDVFLTVQ